MLLHYFQIEPMLVLVYFRILLLHIRKSVSQKVCFFNHRSFGKNNFYSFIIEVILAKTKLKLILYPDLKTRTIFHIDMYFKK